MDKKEIIRRIKAARAFGGFTSVQKLADAINQPGLAQSTLEKIETTGKVSRPQLREIAEACGLPYEFFTVDFSRLPEIVKPGTVSDLPLGEDPDLRKQVEELQRAVDEITPSLKALIDVAQKEPLAQPRQSPSKPDGQDNREKRQQRG